MKESIMYVYTIDVKVMFAKMSVISVRCCDQVTMLLSPNVVRIVKTDVNKKKKQIIHLTILISKYGRSTPKTHYHKNVILCLMYWLFKLRYFVYFKVFFSMENS